MVKKTTYQKIYSFKWLFTLSLVFSLFAFPGVISTTEACRSHPQRIEVVTSEQDNTESTVCSYQIVASKASSNSSGRTREYEFKVQLVQQLLVKELLNTISESSYTHSSPIFFWITRVISSLRDDNTSPPSG